MSTFTAFLLSLTLVVLVEGAAYVSVKPSDTVVEAGDDVTLSCEVVIPDHEAENLMWEHQLAEGGETIFNSMKEEDGTINPDKYEIHGEYNLLIKNPDLDDGGMYSCRLTLTESSPNSADLIVIKHPDIIMPDMVEGRNTTVICRTEFASRRLEDLDDNQIPHMRLKIGNTVVEKGQESITPMDADTRTSHATSLLTYRVDGTPQSEFDDENITCEVWTEAPEFTLSTVLLASVRYSVTNIRVDPKKETYEVGEVIHCRADGNPIPEVRWAPRKTNSKTTWAGANLTVANDMIGTAQTWECTATNTVDTVAAQSLEITFSVVEPKDPSAGGAEKIGASFATAMLLFAITYMFH